MLQSHKQGTALPGKLDEERVIAHYQPILAMDTRRVIGYEVLGRYLGPDGMQSLGPFFTDPGAPHEEQQRIDRRIREQAIAHAAAVPDAAMLFINLKPSWMYDMYRETGELLTLQLLKRYGVDPGRVVVEITEEAFRGSMTALRSVVEVYRREGCLIAVDDAGTGFNSAERIAELQPNLLKVDLHLLKKSGTQSAYLGVLHSFSALAEQIGASLLIEGIETQEELARAIGVGARYVQGYLFSPAAESFAPPDRYAGLLDDALRDYRERNARAERAWRQEGCELAGMLAEEAFGLEEDPDSQIRMLLPRLGARCLRAYLCGIDGIQVSSNYCRSGECWVRQPEYRGADWSWRAYFILNLLAMERKGEAVISRTYTDLETRARIRTLAAAIGPERILFLDMELPAGGNET